MPVSTSTPTFSVDAPAVQKLLANFNTHWKMRFFFIQKLPSLWIWGVRIKSITPQRGEVTIPFNWRSQNPFRSTYFAALAGAAELSTGGLALLATAGRGRVSMLVVKFEAQYLKKADATVTFTCEDGEAIIAAVDRAIATGEGQQMTAISTGRLPNGEIACQMGVTWSFKSK